MKKLRYPEYINGVKQVQCPFKRLCIRIWYSELFRALFSICPIWLIVLMIILLINFPTAGELIKNITIAVYFILLALALAKNDWSELRKIGLDEYHQSIIKNNKNK